MMSRDRLQLDHRYPTLFATAASEAVASFGDRPSEAVLDVFRDRIALITRTVHSVSHCYGDRVHMCVSAIPRRPSPEQGEGNLCTPRRLLSPEGSSL